MSDRRSRKPGEEEEAGPVGVVVIPAYWIMPREALSTIKTIWYWLPGGHRVARRQLRLLLRRHGQPKNGRLSLPGHIQPAHSVLILAGTTTIGTQAAVEYVCRRSSVEQLLLRLAVSPGGEVQPFEAVLHVKVTRGVPLGTELVALRRVVPNSEQ